MEKTKLGNLVPVNQPLSLSSEHPYHPIKVNENFGREFCCQSNVDGFGKISVPVVGYSAITCAFVTLAQC